MDKNTIIKWVLIGGAIYLVYRYLQSSGYLGTTATAATPQVAAATQTQVQAQTQTQTPAASTGPNASQIAAAILAVPGFYYDGGGSTQNAYQWNYWWMRSSLSNNRDAAPAELGVDPNLQMTVDEYAQRVVSLFFSSSGVSGLDLFRLPSPAFASAWRM